jgi:hypothetical protein
MFLDDEIFPYIDEQLTNNSSDYEFYSYIDSLSSHTRIDDIYFNYIDYNNSSNDKINFSGQISLALELFYGSGSDSDRFSRTVKCNFKGYMDMNGIYLEDVTIDDSEYLKE